MVNTTVAQMCPDFCCNTPAECNALGNFRLAAGPTPWEGRLTLNGTQNYLPRRLGNAIAFQAEVAVCAEGWTLRESQVRVSFTAACITTDDIPRRINCNHTIERWPLHHVRLSGINTEINGEP